MGENGSREYMKKQIGYNTFANYSNSETPLKLEVSERM